MTRTILGILLIIQGVWGDDLGVFFHDDQCALRGTSITIQCSYRYPPGERVTTVTWYREEEKPKWILTRLSESSHFNYLGDKSGICTMRINNLQDTDQGTYFFVFQTKRDYWISETLHLAVKGMTAVVPTGVKEGDMVRLICEKACLGSPPANAVWSRDGTAVAGPIFRARLEDAGSYQCAAEGLRSNAVALDVQYLPRNTTVRVEPPGEVLRGSSVNLTCSSVANPPVHSYTWWWRSGTASPPDSSVPVYVGTGQVLHLSSLEASQFGHYLCWARNLLGERSSPTLLLLLPVEETTQESVFVLSGVAVIVFVALLIVVVYCRNLQRTKRRAAASWLSGGPLNSSTNPIEADPMYDNVHPFSLPNRSLPPSQGLHDVHRHESAQEGEIAYSTIGNFRETRPVKHRDRNINPGEKPFRSTGAGDAGDPVIYSTVAQAT